MVTLTVRSGASNGTGARRSHTLHWLFIRDNRAVSCDVCVSGNQHYEVHVTPLWDGETPVLEMPVLEVFDRQMDALRRHLEIASFLRESGWNLARRELVRLAA